MEIIETINLILFFGSTALLGAIRFFEGWKSFFTALTIWVVVLVVMGILAKSFNMDLSSSTGKVVGLLILTSLNFGYCGYLFKKGYLGTIFYR